MLSDTDTYSGDVKEVFVVEGVVVDEDSRRMSEGHGLGTSSKFDLRIYTTSGVLLLTALSTGNFDNQNQTEGL